MTEISSDNLNKIKKTTAGSAVTLILTANKMQTFHDSILKKLINGQKVNCVYITLTHPFPKLKTQLHQQKIDMDTFYFIDAISGNEQIKDEQCTYVQSPQALTQISLAIDSALQVGAFNLLVLDSLSALLNYTNIETAEKFAKFLVNKLKNYGIGGLMLFIDDEKSLKLARIMAQFCDDQITIN